VDWLARNDRLRPSAVKHHGIFGIAVFGNFGKKRQSFLAPIRSRREGSRCIPSWWGSRRSAGADDALEIEVVFLDKPDRHAKIVETAIQWNYTTILNIIFLLLAAMLLVRFFRTGGVKMLKMMNQPAEHRNQNG
jgi:hypothetical protein